MKSACPERTPVKLNHLYHGDALELLSNFPDASIDAIVTDPPYCSGGLTAQERMRPASVKYVQHGQKTDWPDFEGECMDQNAWAQWTYGWLKEARRVARDGAPLVVFTDWRQLPLLTTLVQWAGWRWLGIAVWDKTENCRPQKGRFAAQAEYLVWGTKGRLPWDRQAPSLPGVFRHRVEPPGQKLHLTGKPLSLMEDILRLVETGKCVLDPFAGSGTTLLAAKHLGLNWIGIEASEHYYTTALQRLQEARAQ
jgi:site-specific DNA-methyltransferase (adenine-specific)